MGKGHQGTFHARPYLRQGGHHSQVARHIWDASKLIVLLAHALHHSQGDRRRSEANPQLKEEWKRRCNYRLATGQKSFVATF